MYIVKIESKFPKCVQRTEHSHIWDMCFWFVYHYQSWRSSPVPRQLGHSKIRPKKMLLLLGVNANHSAVVTSYLWLLAGWRWARRAWWGRDRVGSNRAPRWRRGWGGLCRNRTAAGPWGGGGALESFPAPPSGGLWLRSRTPKALSGKTGSRGHKMQVWLSEVLQKSKWQIWVTENHSKFEHWQTLNSSSLFRCSSKSSCILSKCTTVMFQSWGVSVICRFHHNSELCKGWPNNGGVLVVPPTNRYTAKRKGSKGLLWRPDEQ